MNIKIKEKLDFIFKLNSLFDHGERTQFIILVLLSSLMAFFQAIGIASVLPFINMIMNPNSVFENQQLAYIYNLLDFKTVNSFIISSGFAVLGLLIVGNSISALATWYKINFVWKKNHRLSTALLKKYVFMPYSYFLNQNTAELGKNVLFEIQQFTSKFLLSIAMIITDILQVAFILTMLLYINFFVTILATLILVSFYFLIYLNFSNKLRAAGKKRLTKNMERFKSANETLNGIKDIKILGVEDFFLKKFSKSSEVFSSLQSWHHTVSQIPRYIIEVVAFGGIVVLMMFLISLNNSSQEIIPLISLFAFAGYRLVPAFQEIFNSIARIKFNKPVLDKIYADMLEDGVDPNHVNSEKIIPMTFNEEIRLENVHFSYPYAEKAVLENMNLQIKKNTFIALIGATGSGKTTLVDLILGLFFPEKGRFMVDGVKIEEKNVKSWQSNLGYVPQQIYLSDDTIARNIAFGVDDKEIDLKQIKKVAKMANIRNFIENESPHGYNTTIGERGVRLSGGQRQRIGIARALYHDPQVLLFDEATSSLDNATEKEVLEAIEGIAKLKTMIVVAHRLTTVKNCDKVYVIDKGKIVKEGTYNDIIH